MIHWLYIIIRTKICSKDDLNNERHKYVLLSIINVEQTAVSIRTWIKMISELCPSIIITCVLVVVYGYLYIKICTHNG